MVPFGSTEPELHIAAAESFKMTCNIGYEFGDGSDETEKLLECGSSGAILDDIPTCRETSDKEEGIYFYFTEINT